LGAIKGEENDLQSSNRLHFRLVRPPILEVETSPSGVTYIKINI